MKLIKRILFIIPVLFLVLTCSDDNNEPEKFILSVTINPEDGGSVSPDGGVFVDGSMITLTGTPSEGYVFKEWMGDLNETENPVAVSMDSDMNVILVFIKSDGDNDGVPDDEDQCLNSPPGEQVDENGCAPEEVTFIPDDDFEQILIDQGFDSLLDDYVMTSAIKSITHLTLSSGGELHEAHKYSIDDFTGIEGFESLEHLTIYGMKISGESFDLSENTQLKTLILDSGEVDNLELRNSFLEVLLIRSMYGFPEDRSVVKGLDLTGVPSLQVLDIQYSIIDDLNTILDSAKSIENLVIHNIYDGPKLLELSENINLQTIELKYFPGKGPDIVRIKNGANENLNEILIQLFPIYPSDFWEVCFEVDDPTHVLNIISQIDYQGLLFVSYSVGLDCGGS